MTTPSNRFSFRARLLTRACLLLAVAIVSACAAPVTAVHDRKRDPAPDHEPSATHDAGMTPAPDGGSDRAVEVFEAGAGDATVVFESGLGNDWTAWEPVAREVAAEARVFAYSRPGYGHSDPTDDPRDPATIVADLRALLATRGLQPPYVLVGHSFGGTYMELFAKAHPEEVVGLVLVDPRHRDFTSTCEAGMFDGCSIPAAVVATLPPTQIAEFDGFASASDEIRAAGSFGSYPVRVLTATSHGFKPEVEALWVSMLGSLAAEATDGEQKLFPGASHMLHVERPHEVAEAILSVVSALGK